MKSDFRITALLGLGFDLLPCPSALAEYFAGLSSGEMTSPWLTIGLFAGEIAASLSAVGILLHYFGTKIGGRMGKLASPRVWAWGRALVILTVGAIYLGRLLFADAPEHVTRPLALYTSLPAEESASRYSSVIELSPPTRPDPGRVWRKSFRNTSADWSTLKNRQRR